MAQWMIRQLFFLLLRVKLFQQEGNKLLKKKFEAKHTHKMNKRSLLSDADKKSGVDVNHVMTPGWLFFVL